ncbi:MAG TPA: hypothetical protein VF633_00485 [Brevundimonas sp.]|jgi:hypothetical protein
MTDVTNPEAQAPEEPQTLPEGQQEGQEQQPADDPGASETETPEQRQERKRQSFQERIDEKTRLQREAERDRDYWREQATRNQPPPQAQPEPTNGEPDPSQYEYGETDARFIRDLARYETRQEFTAQRQQDEAQRSQAQLLSTFSTNAAKAAETMPDFHEVVGDDYGRAAALCTPAMSAAILESADGPAVAYHLTKNPTEARRIAALSPLAQVREIGRLEGRLSAPTVAQPAPRPSNAPPPPASARGASGQFKVSPETDDFAAFAKQYASG